MEIESRAEEELKKMISSVVSPSSSPPAPPTDSAPPPDNSSQNSAPPPVNSSQNSAPPPVNSSSPPTTPTHTSWQPPKPSHLLDSMFPPLSSMFSPLLHSPPIPSDSPSANSSKSSPPPADSPPANSTDSPPPPTSTTASSAPPADSPPANSTDSPPPPPTPPKKTDSSPPSPDVHSPPPPSSSKRPENSPSESPPAPPTQPTNSPSAPPTQPTRSPPTTPTQPTNSPPAPPTQPTYLPPAPPAQPTISPPTPPTQPTNSPPAPLTQPTNSPPTPPSDPTQSPPIQPSGPANSPPALPNTPLIPFQVALPKLNGGSSIPVASPSLTVPDKETPPRSSGNVIGYQGKTMVGMAVASFAIMGLLAVVFLVRRKKKRNIDSYGRSQYLPHSNFAVKSGKGYSGPMYSSQQQSSMGNSYVSKRGQHQQSIGTPDSVILGTGQTHFSYDELAEITQGFSRQNILGEGGFGCVYKGTLHDGKLVAVKQLKAGSGQGDREFKAEVEIISRVHHRHLVSLVGYCISDQHRLLIYEYVPNQTLEHHLHGKGMPVLEWSKRVRIAIGSAKGLAYLHEDCNPKIIHRDIKSANILLDDVYEAQVADFGLARLNDTTQTHVSTRVMGTFGYLAPEYASSGKLTDRSDVFSFGVVLLELVTGRKPVDQDQPLGEESLVEWARPLLLEAIETGDLSEVIDKRLGKRYVEDEVFRMIETAAACVRHSGPKRPRMVQVVRALDSDGFSGDISNGIKVGQSTAYDSGKYNQDIMKFREMAFGFEDNSESGLYSADYSLKSSSEFSGNESETRPFSTQQF